MKRGRYTFGLMESRKAKQLKLAIRLKMIGANESKMSQFDT